MQLPLTIKPFGQASLQRQIAEQVLKLIANGILAPGTRLPSTRRLGEQIGVARGTVVLAYDRLIEEGYLETRPAAGTSVSRRLPKQFVSVAARARRPRLDHGRAPPQTAIPFNGVRPKLYEPEQNKLSHDFRIGRPDPALFPTRAWRRLLTEKLGGAERALTQYGDPAGYWELRSAIADHLRVARGIRSGPERVIVVAGCQEGLNLVARLLIAKGTKVVIEDPCYQGAAFTFDSFGASLVPVRVDHEGLDVDRLPPDGAELAYVTPSHQFPLAVTMPLDRRLRLLDWAKRRSAFVVEDDYDSDFRYQGSPLLALQALDDAGLVIYLGTFSKSIGAGLRLGYVVVPDHLVEAATTAKALMNNGHPWLEQAVVAEFLRSGMFENHLMKIRHCYMERRAHLIAELSRSFGECRIDGMEGGMHMAWFLPREARGAHDLQLALRPAGVGIYSLRDGPAHQFSRFADDDRIVLLGYPCLSEGKLSEAVARIARALSAG